MNKLLKRISLLILLFIYFTYVILGYNDTSFINFNTYSHLFEVPFLVILKTLNNFIDFRICYFIVFFLGFYIMKPIHAGFFNQIKYAIKFSQDIRSIKNNDKYFSEEKANLMIDILEKTEFSFLKLFSFSYFELLFTGYLIVILSSAFNDTMFSISSLNVLWFSLNGSDLVIFILTLFFMLFNLIFIFKSKTKKNEKIFISLITIGGMLFLVPTVYYSVSFSLFMISSYAIIYIKKVIEVFNNEKTIIKNK